jgi:hypothetical protein
MKLENHKFPDTAAESDSTAPLLEDEKGAVGYLIAWLLGVPAGLLLLIFLIARMF